MLSISIGNHGRTLLFTKAYDFPTTYCLYERLLRMIRAIVRCILWHQA